MTGVMAVMGNRASEEKPPVEWGGVAQAAGLRRAAMKSRRLDYFTPARRVGVGAGAGETLRRLAPLVAFAHRDAGGFNVTAEAVRVEQEAGRGKN